MSVNWSDFISNPQQTSDPADFFAAAVADDGIGILDQDMELGAAPDAYTLTSDLTIRSPEGASNSIKLTADNNGLVFDATEVLSTTLAARTVINSLTVSVASTAGVQIGDFCSCDADLSAMRNGSAPNYTGEQLDMGFSGNVVGITTDTVTLDCPIHWAFDPNRRVTYTAGAGQTRFLYPTVRIAASNVQVFVDEVQQTETTDFVFTGPAGNDPEVAAASTGVWIDFNSAMSGGEVVEFRLTANAPVVFKRSGHLTIENVTLTGDDTDHQQKSIITDRTKGVVYRGITMIGTNTPLDANGYPIFGGVQFINFQGTDGLLDGFTMTGGGYGFLGEGDNFLIRNGTFTDCYEPCQLWFFGHGLTVKNVTATHCTTAIGGHGGFDVRVEDFTCIDSDLNIRSNRVNISNLTFTGKSIGGNTVSLGYSNKQPGDYAEFLNQEDNPAWQVQNGGYVNDCCLENATLTATQGSESISCTSSQNLRLAHVKAAGFILNLTGNSSAPYRVEALVMKDAVFGTMTLRLVKTVRAAAITAGDLVLTADAGRAGGILFSDSAFTPVSQAAPIDDSQVNFSTGKRKFERCLFTDPDATRVTISTNATVEALYELSSCRLNGTPIRGVTAQGSAPTMSRARRSAMGRRRAARGWH